MGLRVRGRVTFPTMPLSDQMKMVLQMTIFAPPLTLFVYTSPLILIEQQPYLTIQHEIYAAVAFLS